MSDAQNPEIVDTTVPSTDYKVREEYAGVWLVEFVWKMPAVTRTYSARFTGDDAEVAAREYADWKNRS